MFYLVHILNILPKQNLIKLHTVETTNTSFTGVFRKAR